MADVLQSLLDELRRDEKSLGILLQSIYKSDPDREDLGVQVQKLGNWANMVEDVMNRPKQKAPMPVGAHSARYSRAVQRRSVRRVVRPVPIVLS